MLYQITFQYNDQLIYKIGITNYDVIQRYRRDRWLLPIVDIQEIEYEDGNEAHLKERELIRKYSQYRFNDDARVFEVTENSEVFTINIFRNEGSPALSFGE